MIRSFILTVCLVEILSFTSASAHTPPANCTQPLTLLGGEVDGKLSIGDFTFFAGPNGVSALGGSRELRAHLPQRVLWQTDGKTPLVERLHLRLGEAGHVKFLLLRTLKPGKADLYSAKLFQVPLALAPIETIRELDLQIPDNHGISLFSKANQNGETDVQRVIAFLYQDTSDPSQFGVHFVNNAGVKYWHWNGTLAGGLKLNGITFNGDHLIIDTWDGQAKKTGPSYKLNFVDKTYVRN
jgi:hypothetical protein